MKKRLIAAGIILAAIIAAIAVRYGNSRDRNSLVLSGTVEVTEVDVGFKIPGKLRTLFTDEGRSVSEGERIAELDSSEFESVRNQARASVRNAEAQFTKAEKDYERATALLEKGVIPQSQMDAARATYDVASSQLELSRAALRTAEVRLSDAKIAAPLSGIVLRKNVEAGETVAAGMPVFTIADLDRPWIKVYVKEDRLGLIALGQKADVTVDSFPGKKFEGTITHIASDAEFTPKTVQTREERVRLVFGVKVSVRNESHALKPGMPADVILSLK